MTDFPTMGQQPSRDACPRANTQHTASMRFSSWLTELNKGTTHTPHQSNIPSCANTNLPSTDAVTITLKEVAETTGGFTFPHQSNIPSCANTNLPSADAVTITLKEVAEATGGFTFPHLTTSGFTFPHMPSGEPLHPAGEPLHPAGELQKNICVLRQELLRTTRDLLQTKQDLLQTTRELCETKHELQKKNRELSKYNASDRLWQHLQNLTDNPGEWYDQLRRNENSRKFLCVELCKNNPCPYKRRCWFAHNEQELAFARGHWMCKTEDCPEENCSWKH